MASNFLSRRVPSKVKAIPGGHNAEFYFGGGVMMDSIVASNGNNTTRTIVEVQDKRRNHTHEAFYFIVAGARTVTYEAPHYWPYGFRVITGDTARTSVVYTSSGNE